MAFLGWGRYPAWESTYITHIWLCKRTHGARIFLAQSQGPRWAAMYCSGTHPQRPEARPVTSNSHRPDFKGLESGRASCCLPVGSQVQIRTTSLLLTLHGEKNFPSFSLNYQQPFGSLQPIGPVLGSSWSPASRWWHRWRSACLRYARPCCNTSESCRRGTCCPWPRWRAGCLSHPPSFGYSDLDLELLEPRISASVKLQHPATSPDTQQTRYSLCTSLCESSSSWQWLWGRTVRWFPSGCHRRRSWILLDSPVALVEETSRSLSSWFSW